MLRLAAPKTRRCPSPCTAMDWRPPVASATSVARRLPDRRVRTSGDRSSRSPAAMVMRPLASLPGPVRPWPSAVTEPRRSASRSRTQPAPSLRATASAVSGLPSMSPRPVRVRAGRDAMVLASTLRARSRIGRLSARALGAARRRTTSGSMRSPLTVASARPPPPSWPSTCERSGRAKAARMAMRPSPIVPSRPAVTWRPLSVTPSSVMTARRRMMVPARLACRPMTRSATGWPRASSVARPLSTARVRPCDGSPESVAAT